MHTLVCSRWASCVAALLMASFYVSFTPKSKKKMKSTIILVHGAFAGQNSWQFIKPMLEKDGHTVVTLDLPGPGDDTTPPGQATFDSYCSRRWENDTGPAR